MQWPAACVVMVIFYSGGGVTTTSGLSQFWTDDYKVFDQVYGKTSDRDIYGDTLPAAVSFNGIIKAEATEKKEKYLLTDDPDEYGSRYANIVKQSLSLGKARKPPKAYSFISYENSNPIISQETDPETYNYLKHLENYEREKEKGIKKFQFAEPSGGFKPITSDTDPQFYGYMNHLINNKKAKKEIKKTAFPISVGGFRQYLNYEGRSPEESEGYKSIQDILEAHEANQEGIVESEQDYVNSITYTTSKPITKARPSRVSPKSNFKNEVKARCQPGRCRKRAANAYRVRKPYLRRVKHRIVED